MKKIIKLFFVVSLVFLAQQSFAESIEKYNVDISLDKDASLSITETIDYDFGTNVKHGIFRFIPLSFEVQGQKKKYGLEQRSLKIDKIFVKRNGVSERYVLEEKDNNGNYFIKIGKENETITGIQTYEISYMVQGSLRYFDDYDEVYWNAIGLDWKVPISHVEILLQSDNISFINNSCYTGKVNSQKKCDGGKIMSDGSILFSQETLNAYEGLTIAASFDKNNVERVEFFIYSDNAIFLLIISLCILFAGLGKFLIKKYQRKFFVKESIYPRYSPPENLDAALTGYLINRKVSSKDISARIIELARDGYITIEKINSKTFFKNFDDYIFELQLNDNLKLIDSQKELLLKLLFGNNFTRYTSHSYTSRMSELSKVNSQMQLTRLYKKIKQNIHEFSYLDKKEISLRFLPLVLFFTVFALFSTNASNIATILFFITFMSILFSSRLFIPARYTKKGWKTKHAVEGFKLFLEMTEKERYNFFNNPADNPQEFMQYLPYAVVLGVEKKWAEQFKSITIKQPEWFKGTGPFVAGTFVHDISSFSKSVSSSTATRSSSGSGSRGGGSSGGGSGGGGGGSW